MIHETNWSGCEIASRHVVTFLYMLVVYMLAAFDERHSVDQAAHEVFIFVGYLNIWVDAGEVAHLIDVSSGVVLAGGCPCRYDHGHPVAVVMSDITTEENESGTEAVCDVDELLKVGVVRIVPFSQPYIADAYVEGVVIADAPGDDRWLFHRS